MKRWVEQLKESGPKDISNIEFISVLAIVGNKIDRYEEEEVDYNEVKSYANSINAIYKLVSAKDGKNIADLFASTAEKAIESEPSKQKGNQLNKKSKKKGACC